MEARDKIIKDVEEKFRSRMASGNVKPGSAAYKKARIEFFVGAMAGMNAMKEAGEFKNSEELSEAAVGGLIMPPRWVFGIMRGDDFEIEEDNI